MNYIDKFNVYHNPSLGSDQTPITVDVIVPTDASARLTQATMLGPHAVLRSCHNKRTNVRCHLRWRDCSNDDFLLSLAQYDGSLWHDDVDEFANGISNVLYGCSKASCCQDTPQPCNMSQDRWDRLLQDDDDARVWCAINWKGEVAQKGEQTVGQDEQTHTVPSDEEFKLSLEGVLNSPNTW